MEKRKMFTKKEDNPSNQKKEPQLTPEQIAHKEQMELLQGQNQLLQEQLKQKNDADESLRLEQKAEKLKLEQAALEEEANLKRTLGMLDLKPPKTELGDENEQFDIQQLINGMGDAVGKAIEANNKLQEAKIAKLIQAQDDRSNVTQNALIKLMANMSVNEARSEHKDFDVYKDDISSILSKTQGMSPEDAYLLAKAKRQSLQPDATTLESERPHDYLSRSRERSNFTPPNREQEESRYRVQPRKQFADAVSAAIDKVVAARGGQP
jgi:hypothetical protein